MCSKYAELFAALAAPFARDEVKTRPQGGRQLQYVTARTIMNRLDAVIGPENWTDEYTPLEHGVVCRLTLRLPDGTQITKCDAGGNAGMSDAGDDDKSGFSDAFKRAAVKFGPGRYLYRDGVANLSSAGLGPAVAASEAPAAPPAVAAPPAAAVAPPRAGSEDAQGRGGKAVHGQARASKAPSKPRTGMDLHFYCADNAIDPNLAKWVTNSHRDMGYPDKLVDWSDAEVASALPTIKEHLMTVKQARDRMNRAG